MILYHVTLFNKPTQEILIPRIPGDTSIGEEVKTNRICLAPSIIQCLRALEIYKYFQEDTLDVKVYKIVVDENDEQLISWEQLYLNGLVDDAALTHEYWYKSKLIPVEYNEYRISESVLDKGWAGLDTPEVTDGITAIRSAASTEDASAAWADLQEFLYEYGAASVIGHYTGVNALSTKVEGYDYLRFPILWNATVSK